MKRAKEEFSPVQVTALEQRMVLLDTFVDATVDETNARFQAGQLTVIDLSDPFVDASSACALFEIVTRMFVRAEVDTGKVLVVDEAHKVRSSVRIAARVASQEVHSVSIDHEDHDRADEGPYVADPTAAAFGDARHHQHTRYAVFPCSRTARADAENHTRAHCPSPSPDRPV